MPKSKQVKSGKITQKGPEGYSVEGDMTFDTVRTLLQESKGLFTAGSNVKLNLSEVQQADSAGLALLLEWIAQARKAGVEVSVDGVPDSLKAIARLCRMEDELDDFVAPKR